MSWEASVREPFPDAHEGLAARRSSKWCPAVYELKEAGPRVAGAGLYLSISGEGQWMKVRLAVLKVLAFHVLSVGLLCSVAISNVPFPRARFA